MHLIYCILNNVIEAIITKHNFHEYHFAKDSAAAASQIISASIT